MNPHQNSQSALVGDWSWFNHHKSGLDSADTHSNWIGSSIWDLFPTLSLMSVSFVLMELYKRYKSGEISETEFKEMSVKATGIKVTKFALLMGIMCIPVVNVAVGAALVARVLYSLTSSANLLSIVDIPKELSKADYQKPLSKLIGNKT